MGDAISVIVARSRIVLVLLLSSVWSLGCGDQAEQVKTGMTDAQVRGVLGDESWVLTEKGQVRLYLAQNDQCAQSATKVLVYDRVWFRSDVFVAVDDAGRVVCRLGGQLIKR